MDPQKVIEDHLGSGIPQGWSVVPVMSGDGQMIGGQMRKGTEVHTVLAPEFRGKGMVNKENLKLLFEPMLEQFGFVTSKALKDDRASQVFMRRIGFVKTWEDEHFCYFMLTRI